MLRKSLVIFCVLLVALGSRAAESTSEKPEQQGNGLVFVAEGSADNNGPDMKNSHLSAESRTAYKLFVPTNEWQVVPEGMAVPEGAHIRMNMATGKTEVKLMEGAKSAPNIAVLSDGEQDSILSSRHKLFSQEELSEALEGIAPEDVVTDEDRERVAKTYRSMDELKQDFEKISASFKSDFQILRGLIDELKNDSLDKERIQVILEDIEYLAHQVDNGVEIAKMGAIPILLRFANGSDADLAESSLLCLGATMQSNRFVQDAVLNAGVLPILYKILLEPIKGDHPKLRSRALYALSTLLRQFPPAQQQFLSTGGVTFLKRLFSGSMSKETIDEHFAVKVVGLVGDLVTENDAARSPSAETPTAGELARRRQYQLFNFRQSVVDADWCNSAALLLSSSKHDAREKALRLMTLIAEDCHNSYNLPVLRQALHVLLAEYELLAATEQNKAAEVTTSEPVNDDVLKLADAGEDDYFHRMAGNVKQLLFLVDKQTGHQKAEL